MTKKLFTLLVLSLFTIIMLVSCGGNSTDPLCPPEGTETTITSDDWTKAVTLEGYDSFTFDWTVNYEESEDSAVVESANEFGTFKYNNLNYSESSNEGYVTNDTLYQKPSSILNVIRESSLSEFFDSEYFSLNYEDWEYDESTKAYTYTITKEFGETVKEVNNIEINIYFSDKAIYSISYSHYVTEPGFSASIIASILFSNWNATTVEQ